MKLRNYLIAGAATAGLALPTIAAAQTPAQVTTDLNLRAGPGTNHAAIGVMPRGAQVQIHQCPGSWCQVSYGGTTGWASQRYLSTGFAAQPRTRTYAVAPQPRVTFGFDVGPRYRYGSRYHRRHFHPGWYDDHYYDGRRWYYDDAWHARPRTGFSFSFGS